MLGPGADWRAVFARLPCGVVLLDLRPIDVLSEGRADRLFVDPVAVSAELDATRHPAGEIGEEDFRIVLRALADQPGGDQLRVGADGRERPYIAVARRPLELLRHVFLLRVAIGPDLVSLHHLALEVGEDPRPDTPRKSRPGRQAA